MKKIPTIQTKIIRIVTRNVTTAFAMATAVADICFVWRLHKKNVHPCELLLHATLAYAQDDHATSNASMNDRARSGNNPLSTVFPFRMAFIPSSTAL